MSDTQIQWYPGHIAKLERELQTHLKPLDVVIEVLDARIPRASAYTALSEKVRAQKPVLLILNKSDLADPAQTARWIEHLQTIYPGVTAYNSSSSKGREKVISLLEKLGDATIQKHMAKGLKRRPVRAGVIGMPNVGKSSLINALVGRKKARTGHRAGVTRTPQWVRIHPAVELLDTPGLIPAKLSCVETGKLLASVYSVGDAAFDEEAILPFFIDCVHAAYPGLLTQALDIAPETPLTLEAIAQRRQTLLSGGELDLRRAAQSVLKDYRHGHLGRITLEQP